MCGRVAVKYDADWLRRRYGTVNPPVNFAQNFNGAPTEQLPVVRLVEGKRHLDLLRWGLVPLWAKDLKIGAQCINAGRDSRVEGRLPRRLPTAPLPHAGEHLLRVDGRAGREAAVCDRGGQ